ncbi:MAG: hypothetical protein V1846_02705 [Candidatus Komeilibacteria bacterium]
MSAPYPWQVGDFHRAVAEKRLVQAENWLGYVRKHRAEYPYYDDTWVAHCELELFESYCNMARITGATVNWGHARRVAEESLTIFHRRIRLIQLERVSGIKLEEIQVIPLPGS